MRTTATATASIALLATTKESDGSSSSSSGDTDGSGSSGGGKRKRRRRKQPSPAATSDSSFVVAKKDDSTADRSSSAATKTTTSKISEQEKKMLKEIAKFQFPSPKTNKLGNVMTEFDLDDIIGIDDDDDEDDAMVGNPDLSSGSSISLPSLEDAVSEKALRQELAALERQEEEQEQQKRSRRIKRSDKEAFDRLLEQSPYADADDSLFEEEEYSTVSALLGERAKPFLGIPTGPLQVGHFIGALGLVLCAYVEYPGFPLTNLPSPLRGALQGGLAAVYGINVALAIYAVGKAMERGQPIALWVAKTLSVGGLALDQLTQLPTLAQIQEAESRKEAQASNKTKNR